MKKHILCLFILLMPCWTYAQKKKRQPNPEKWGIVNAGILLSGADHQEFNRISYGLGLRKIKNNKFTQYGIHLAFDKDVRDISTPRNYTPSFRLTKIQDRVELEYIRGYSLTKDIQNGFNLGGYLKLIYNGTQRSAFMVPAITNDYLLGFGVQPEYQIKITKKQRKREKILFRLIMSLDIPMVQLGLRHIDSRNPRIPESAQKKINKFHSNFLGDEIVFRLGMAFEL